MLKQIFVVSFKSIQSGQSLNDILVRKDKWLQDFTVIYFVRAECPIPVYIVNLISNKFGHLICLHIWSNN